MARARTYTPQLRPEVVSRLYHAAKAEGVPMTVLAHRIMEQALEDRPPPAADRTADAE